MERIAKKKRVRYDRNPFMAEALASTKGGTKKLINNKGDQMMIVSESTGEIIGPAGIWQRSEVDRAQFVKVYLNGVKSFNGLSNSGIRVFEVLYRKVQESIGKDVITMSFPRVDQNETPMSKATFFRGISELVEKKFIAESVIPGDYYLNSSYRWNGDRWAYVKEYVIKATGTPKRDDLTMNLFNDLLPQLPQLVETPKSEAA